MDNYFQKWKQFGAGIKPIIDIVDHTPTDYQNQLQRDAEFQHDTN
jgi:hypothetical protein